MSRPPQYSEDSGISARQVTESKRHPPGYEEATAGRPTSGETYAEKFHVDARTPRAENRPTSFIVHATETGNIALLANAMPMYVIDKTTSLSKSIVRIGKDTAADIVSTSAIVRPFVKEVVTTYTSKRRSGTLQTTIEAKGTLRIVWYFCFGQHTYEWKTSKGVMTCYLGKKIIASYDIGSSFDIDELHTAMADVLVSTAFAILYFDRMTNERRVRALNAVTGRSMNGPGALLGGSYQ